MKSFNLCCLTTEEWSERYNAIAALYNEARREWYLELAEQEITDFNPRIDNLSVDIELWKKCYMQLLNS